MNTRNRLSGCTALIAASFVGACSPSEMDVTTGTAASGIVNGVTDSDDAAVVLLLKDGLPFCSGVLVAPRVVVTAAHCLVAVGFGSVLSAPPPPPPGGPPPPPGGLPPPPPPIGGPGLSVFFGSSLAAGGQAIPVVGGGPHPFFDPDAFTSFDIGVIALAYDAPATPVAIARESADTFVGQTIRLVGFGVDDAFRLTGEGIKRQASLPVVDKDPFVLFFDGRLSSACYGDSGGPAFIRENGVDQVAAIASFADSSCAFYNGYTRIDLYADSFIQPFIDGLSGGAIPPLTICDPNGPDRVPPRIDCSAVSSQCGDPRPSIATARDNCGPVQVSCTTTVLNGRRTRSCTATDVAGNQSSCGVPLFDSQPPTFTTRPNLSLWSPDHSYRGFRLSDCVADAFDACDGPIDVNARGQIVLIASDESENLQSDGSGNTCDDIVISGSATAKLRAERSGKGNGRAYQIVFQLSDAAGNTSMGICGVDVPSSSSSGPAIVDACEYCVDGDGFTYCEDWLGCPGHDLSCR